MKTLRDTRLPIQQFMAFPFRLTDEGAAVTSRLGHIRQQVEQVLFTSPGERVFRPEFAFGARQMVFEPNRAQMWEVSRNRLLSALAEALTGEIDPKTLSVEVGATPDRPERLLVRITYTVAALHKEETHDFVV